MAELTLAQLKSKLKSIQAREEEEKECEETPHY
jgi:hypothetical protein